MSEQEDSATKTIKEIEEARKKLIMRLIDAGDQVYLILVKDPEFPSSTLMEKLWNLHLSRKSVMRILDDEGLLSASRALASLNLL